MAPVRAHACWPHFFHAHSLASVDWGSTAQAAEENICMRVDIIAPAEPSCAGITPAHEVWLEICREHPHPTSQSANDCCTRATLWQATRQNRKITVAILAQGTSWAVAVTASLFNILAKLYRKSLAQPIPSRITSKLLVHKTVAKQM